LRYLSEDAEVAAMLDASTTSEIIFNYLGQFDQNGEAAPEANLMWKSLSLASDVNRDRGYLLELTGLVSGGRLVISFSYSENLYRRSTIERLVQAYVGALRGFINGETGSVQDGFIPSDFPETNLTQARLDKLIAFLDQTGESYEQA
jgi:non-ribosomal peptide synthase protein (TIGR01720 family)